MPFVTKWRLGLLDLQAPDDYQRIVYMEGDKNDYGLHTMPYTNNEHNQTRDGSRSEA